MAKNTGKTGHPLAPVCDQWVEKIRLGQRYKHDRFGKYAEECAKFFDGPHNFMWQEDYATARGSGGFLSSGSNGWLPRFRMTVNKPFEAVALFGPALYHQNPNIQVSVDPDIDIDPASLGIDDMDQQGMAMAQSMAAQVQVGRRIDGVVAETLQKYANWVQREGDKRRQARRAITEAIVKGCSLLVTGIDVPPGSNIRIPVSRYKSIDDLVVDPDAEYWEDVQWCALRCVHPINLVEAEYGIEPGILRGHYQSADSQGNLYGSIAETGERKRRDREGIKDGRTHDLLEYWRIYSKNGMGQHLSRQTEGSRSVYSRFDFTPFGQHVHLAVARGVPFPLNLPTDSLGEPMESLVRRAAWPIPFWADANSDGGWPFSRLYFVDKPNSVWPISIFKPVIGELRFVNWCMSFLADKVASTCQTYVGVLREAGAEIQKQLKGQDTPFTVIELSAATGGSIDKIVSFIQAPAFPTDIWHMVSEVMQQIDKRTGLTELMYGLSSRQLRSAREADVKEQSVSVRPDDMASQTEDFLSSAAAKELQAAAWVCRRDDVDGALGPVAAEVWERHIVTQDLDQLFRDFKVRVEAGSSRKPNKATRADQLQQFGSVAMPAIQEMAMAGQVGPWNAYVAATAKALDLDPTPFMLQPPPPPPQPQGPSPEEMQVQLEQQRAQLEQFSEQMRLMMDQERHDQEMEQDSESHEQEMEQNRERMRLEEMKVKSQAKASPRKPSSNGRKR